MTITNELIDSMLVDYKKPEDLIGENGLLRLLTKKLMEPALQAGMAEHQQEMDDATAGREGDIDRVYSST